MLYSILQFIIKYYEKNINSFFLLFLVSCVSNEDAISLDIPLSKENTYKYENFRNEAKFQIVDIYNQLQGLNSRSYDEGSLTGEDLVDVLVEMPVETVDSLYNIYCKPEILELYDEIQEEFIVLLVESTSSGEVKSLFEFMHSYAECYGHNRSMLNNALEENSSIIQNAIICVAAVIDEFTDGMTFTRGYHTWCEEQLMQKIMLSVAQDALVDSAMALIPGSDVVSLCIGA